MWKEKVIVILLYLFSNSIYGTSRDTQDLVMSSEIIHGKHSLEKTSDYIVREKTAEFIEREKTI